MAVSANFIKGQAHLWRFRLMPIIHRSLWLQAVCKLDLKLLNVVPLKRSCIQRLHYKSSPTCMRTVLPMSKDTPGVEGPVKKKASSTMLRQLQVETKTRRSFLQSDLLPCVHHRRLVKQRRDIPKAILLGKWILNEGRLETIPKGRINLLPLKISVHAIQTHQLLVLPGTDRRQGWLVSSIRT